jgi:hypothetical protein
VSSNLCRVREAAQGSAGANLTVLSGATGLSEVATGLVGQGLAIFDSLRGGLDGHRPDAEAETEQRAELTGPQQSDTALDLSPTSRSRTCGLGERWAGPGRGEPFSARIASAKLKLTIRTVLPDKFLFTGLLRSAARDKPHGLAESEAGNKYLGQWAVSTFAAIAHWRAPSMRVIVVGRRDRRCPQCSGGERRSHRGNSWNAPTAPTGCPPNTACYRNGAWPDCCASPR